MFIFRFFQRTHHVAYVDPTLQKLSSLSQPSSFLKLLQFF